MLHNEMKSMKKVDLSANPSELWSCQWDGITVFDDQLNILHTMKGHGDRPCIYSIANISDDQVAVAGFCHLYLSTKSG